MPIPENTIYLDELSKGTYTSLNVDERNAGKYNKPDTDAKYARRIKFWMDNNFVEQRESSKPEHPLYWIVEHHQHLMYKIMTYHNQQNNSLSSLNSDFKALVRIVKLILGNKSELRYKLSALQIGLSELENANDDENKISSLQEDRQYIPYEELLDKCKKLEDEYVEKATDIERFTIYQLLLCVALYVWDYPSRQEKFTLEFMEEGEIAEDGKNYVVIPKGKNKKRCSFIFNEVKKNHQPIEYEIKTSNKELDILNKKLSDLLKYSYRKYPRRYVFVGKKVDKTDTLPKLKAKTITEWVRDMYVNKNLGIDGFRSSYVSYYLQRMNNLEKKVMATRMRTSIDIMYRSYLKLPSISEKEEKAVEKPENEKVEKTITILPNRREQSKENF